VCRVEGNPPAHACFTASRSSDNIDSTRRESEEKLEKDSREEGARAENSQNLINSTKKQEIWRKFSLQNNLKIFKTTKFILFPK
jgi:hypothetical protein